MTNPYFYMMPHVHRTISYPEFCELTKEPEYSDKQKRKAQIKNWSNYMSITTKYNRIILNKIYSGDEMLLIDHNVKFTEYISDLIIFYLANSKNDMETLTYKEFAEYFYMVNKDYYIAKYQRQNYVDHFNLSTDLVHFTKEAKENRINEDIGMFFYTTDSIIKSIIRNALKSLERRGLIFYNANFKLYKTIKIGATNKYIMKVYTCNKQQRKEFLDIRKKIMRKYGIEKLQDIIYLDSVVRKNYFNDLKSEMSKSEILKYANRYANAFDIEYGVRAVDYEYQRIMSKNRYTVNNNMQYKLLTTKELQSINTVLKKQFIDEFITK